VFQELVRASEGVARDLLNIFSTSFFSVHRKGKEIFNSFVYALLGMYTDCALRSPFLCQPFRICFQASVTLVVRRSEGGSAWSQFVQRSSQPFQSTVEGDNVEVK
jgi:hypothetical protein